MTLNTLHGIATALYGTEVRSTLSLATLVSTDKDNIFIDKVDKIQLDPRRSKEIREAFQIVLDAIVSNGPDIEYVNGRVVQAPTIVVHGVPEIYPTVYDRVVRNAFTGLFNKKSPDRVLRFTHDLFLLYHEKKGIAGSLIELHPTQLYLSDEDAFSATIDDSHITASEELDKLYTAAKSGDKDALELLEAYTTLIARSYMEDMNERRIVTSRFIQYGFQRPEFQNCSAYTFLDWFNLKDIFVRKLIDSMPIPHNICVKSPNDKSNPPFADIAATYIADQWDRIYETSPGHVVAKYSKTPTAFV